MDKITETYRKIVNQDVDSLLKEQKITKLIMSYNPNLTCYTTSINDGYFKITVHSKFGEGARIIATYTNGGVNIDSKDDKIVREIIQLLKQNGFDKFVINYW